MRTEEQKQKTKELVAALRSGKYKQTTERLTKDGAYCCLGVACIVAGGKFDEDGCIENQFAAKGKDENWLPEFVMDVFGFKSLVGSFDPITLFDDNSLITLNDTLHWTFNQIADLIEKEPKGLFIE